MILFFEKMKRNNLCIKLLITRNGWKKAKYLKKKKVFKSMGEKCYFHSNYLPAEPFLVSMGDNVIIAADVRLVTHSAEHIVFNYEDKTSNFRTRFGEIKIGSNVFIGAGTIILFDVEIGNNVIIGAGSVVTKNIPSNSVVGGIPAKTIGTYDALKEKNKIYSEKFKNCKSRRVCDMYEFLKKS